VTYPLGVVEIVFAPASQAEAAELAAGLGFDHIDLVTEPGGPLALPIVDRFVAGTPRPDWSSGAPPAAEGNWERAVRAFRKAPGSRVEPWAGSIIDSVEKIRAFLSEAPETTLLLDTGHVANWGEDPAELIPYAGHIQLRQARRGVPQAAEGDIDFARFITELDRLGYDGALSVEYFDLPDYGYPLDDPIGHAIALAERVRALL
jgi:sugar phosphate isomerase/epimerase